MGVEEKKNIRNGGKVYDFTPIGLVTNRRPCYTQKRVQGTKGHTTAGVISSCLFL